MKRRDAAEAAPGRGGARGHDEWSVAGDEAGAALAAFLRSRRPEASWGDVKKWIASGKVVVDGIATTGAGLRLRAGQAVGLRMSAPRARTAAPGVRIVHEDAHVVVIDKPAGLSAVPYERGERGTAIEAARRALDRGHGPAPRPLRVVHRIDKATSGLLVHARTRLAERGLASQFRTHAVARTYLCVAHGQVAAGRIETFLVPDRGDGLRGSSRRPGLGKRAVTDVEIVRELPECTLCRVRLHTGRTHQIRIHLAESGHPLVGETVYVRDVLRAGGSLLQSPRLLLHASTLGFTHPVTGERLFFEAPLPADFASMLEALGG